MLTKGTQCHIIKVGDGLIKFDHYDFNPQKDERLRRDRGIGFEEIVTLIDRDRKFRVFKHPNVSKYPHQFVFAVDVDGYIHLVPFVLDGTCAFLKTIFPSRKATKQGRRKT